MKHWIGLFEIVMGYEDQPEFDHAIAENSHADQTTAY